MDLPWYKKSNFRNLVDMHITNIDDQLLSEFDPEVYAENMKIAGFDSAYVYGSNCQGLCFFPSKTGYLHQETEKRDLFGEVINALQKRGIRPLGYLNHWCSVIADDHPEWQTVTLAGEAYRDRPGHRGRYGICCFNSPYRNLMLQRVREICTNYPIEALWIDMITYATDVCACESCRKLYKEETGKDIPLIADWTDPEWRRYIDFRQRRMVQYITDIAEVAKECRPGITISGNCAGWIKSVNEGHSAPFFRVYDYTSGDFYQNIRNQTVDCKFLRKASANQPFEYMVPRCPDLIYHTGSKPIWQIRQQAYSAFLHGGAFLLIDAIDPMGTLNRDVYKTFHDVRNDLTPYWSLPSFLKGEYQNDVAVYMNFRSTIDLSVNGKSSVGLRTGSSPLIKRLKIINENLVKRHVQYDIISDLNLDELDKYPLIILSEVYTLSKKEVEAFRNYVKNGGQLYISGRTGIIDDIDSEAVNGSLKREDFALSDIMGVSLTGEDFPYDSCYVKGAEVSEIFDEASMNYPVGTKAPAPKVSAHEGTKILAYATLPLSSHEDPRRYLTAIGDPPWTDTTDPILTEHNYGKGKCVYCSLLLEDDLVQPAVGELWLDVIDMMLKGKRKMNVDAPLCVESSIKTVDDTLCISLLNIMQHEMRSPAGETKIWISKDLFNANSVECFPSGTVSLEKTEDGAIVRASNLPEFAVVTVK